MTSHHNEPRVQGQRSRPRLTGEAREAKRKELARGYEEHRQSIRSLAAEHDLSYGTTRLLLLEAGVRLRTRGGRPRP